MSDFDVIIAGAGPGGAIAAWQLARDGFSVLLLEKYRLPRYKPCGGGISAKTARLLDSGWSELAGDITRKVIFTYRYQSPISVEFDTPLIYMVMRSNFDAWLVARAKEAGVEILENTRVTGLEETPHQVIVQTPAGEHYARFLVGADGATSTVARSLGLNTQRRLSVAVEGEFSASTEQMSLFRNSVVLNHGSVPRGYDWIFPKQNHLSVGTGTFSTRITKIGGYLEQFTQRQTIQPTSRLSLKGHPIPTLKSQNPVFHSRRSVLVGDAGGLVDPLSGEGIYNAVKSARFAAEVISQNLRRSSTDLAAYTTLLHQEILPELTQARHVARAVFTFPFVVHRLVRSDPEILRRLLQVVFGSSTYKDLYSYLADKYTVFRR